MLKIIFPALMVIGAIGSLITNLSYHGHYAVSMQWIGAAILYAALMVRNAWNNGEVDVLLVHPASCAYGLNLQAGGHHVVWYGLNWSFELNDQGNCRLWRQGSPYDKVYIHYLIVQGCQDEDVMATIRDRADTHEAVMRALKARIKRMREGTGS